jgi:hypothetical protein
MVRCTNMLPALRGRLRLLLLLTLPLTFAGRNPLHKTWIGGTTCSITQNIVVLISYTCGEKRARCLGHPPIRGASGSRHLARMCDSVLAHHRLFLIMLLLESIVSSSTLGIIIIGVHAEQTHHSGTCMSWKQGIIF